MKVQKELRSLASAEIAEKSKRYFKFGPGEYSEGDIFLGIKAPTLRKIAKENVNLPINDVKKLIRSKYHEERMTGLFILTNKFEKTKDENQKNALYQIYLSNMEYINNWDLVDVSCPKIMGRYLMNRDRSILYELAKSNNIWERRISIITNWWFIRKGDVADIFKLSEILLNDEHDLIHKAVGWMLREAHKKYPKET